MLDETTNEGKAVSAALRLATERRWRDVTLGEIAQAAGLGIADLHACGLSSKSDLLVALLSAVDREVLRNAPSPDDGQPARDRLFEVLMARLDALEPHKPALKSIAKSMPFDASLMRKAWSSQGWMLEAAGINSAGLSGAVKAAGLGTVYAQVLQVWLNEDDPGLPRTMAMLDRRLRRGEKVISGVDEALRSAQRFGEGLFGLACRLRKGPRRPATDATDQADTEAQTPPVTFPDPPEASPPGSA